jgi:hypothetical protein
MTIKKSKRKVRKAYHRLPKIFQKRIMKFIMTKEGWLEEFGPYEIFCCTEAVKIAKFCKTKEKVIEFKSWSVETQYKHAKLDSGHSGNTFGQSVLLAYHYLNDPDGVIIEHGSLCILVGCPVFGCPHPPPDYVIEMLSPEGQKRLREVLAKKEEEAK